MTWRYLVVLALGFGLVVTVGAMLTWNAVEQRREIQDDLAWCDEQERQAVAQGDYAKAAYYRDLGPGECRETRAREVSDDG